MSNWFSVLKIRTQDGEMMTIPSIEEYHEKFREELRPVVLAEYRKVSDRATEASKINIKRYSKTPGFVEYDASWRDRNTEKTHSIIIKYKGSGKEDEPHEVIAVFSDNLGPELQMGTDFKANTPYDFLQEVVKRIEDFYQSRAKTESLGVPSIEEDEDRVSTEEYNRSLEEGNPGYRMVEGKLRNLADMERLARIKGINLNELLARNNLTMADFVDEMPQEPQPEEPAPREPRVNERRERMRGRRDLLRPRRGRRGPVREEE